LERQINMLLVFLYMCFKAIQCKWLILWCHLVISKSKTFRNICIYFIWFSWISNIDTIGFFFDLITFEISQQLGVLPLMIQDRQKTLILLNPLFIIWLTDNIYIFINVMTYNILFTWMIFGYLNLNAHKLSNFHNLFIAHVIPIFFRHETRTIYMWNYLLKGEIFLNFENFDLC